VATLNVIRRWALRDQMSVREISRRTGLARNTIKKHLRSEESEPKYPRRASSSKLDPYAEKLATWLVIEATKSRKQRRTLRQIHTDSAQKGENQELIHIVSTFCSQRVWVNIRWKTRVRLQRNSTQEGDIYVVNDNPNEGNMRAPAMGIREHAVIKFQGQEITISGKIYPLSDELLIV